MEAIKQTLAEVKRVVLAIHRDTRTIALASGIRLEPEAEWPSGDESAGLIALPVTVTAIRFQGTVESAKRIQRLVHSITDYQIEYRQRNGGTTKVLMREWLALPADLVLTTPTGDDFELPAGWWIIIDDDRALHAYEHKYIKNYYTPKGI